MKGKQSLLPEIESTSHRWNQVQHGGYIYARGARSRAESGGCGGWLKQALPSDRIL